MERQLVLIDLIIFFFLKKRAAGAVNFFSTRKKKKKLILLLDSDAQASKVTNVKFLDKLLKDSFISLFFV